MTVVCPYCHNDAKLVSSLQFYGKDYGTNIWVCRPCGAYVGTHGRTATPKGTLADYRLRKWRIEAHSKFDPLWKSGKMKRTKAYEWMQRAMDLSKELAHIGMMDVEQCISLIRKIEEEKKNGTLPVL